MRVTLTPADLAVFEDEVAEMFLNKELKSPIHLAGGNEEQLIEIFREHVNEPDWILCSWRSHFHCLLKGVPPDQLRKAILAGRSISLCFPEYRILSSGIAGGTAPIAVGLALGIQRKNERRKVVCFLGDASAATGGVKEAITYSEAFDLPILWVIEDNGVSVATEFSRMWGSFKPIYSSLKCIHYQYKLTRPHCGINKWVSF